MSNIAFVCDPSEHRKSPQTRFLAWSASAALFLAALIPFAQGQIIEDDFSDGNDTGWTHYQPLELYGVPGVYTVVNGGYRIQTTMPTGMAENPPRAGSVREDASYTDFYVAVDVVDWNDDVHQAFGVLGRIGTPGLQQTTGYAFTYERGSGVTPTSGDFDISRLDQEVPDQIEVEPSAYHLNAGTSYRFVFLGKGPSLEARVYELPNTISPVLRLTANDATYPTGFGGVVVYDNSGGNGVTDATFDNYYSAPTEPVALQVELMDFGDIRISWPADATDFILESSLVLPATNWVTVPPEQITTINDRLTHDEPGPTSGDKFFRLVKP